MRARRAAVLVALVLAVKPVRGAEGQPAPLPDDAALEAAGAVIGEIEIRVGDVFDPTQPGENRRLFRWANKLHINTREIVIRRLLLFRVGDRYARRALDESERLLRRQVYLYDAHIAPVRYEDGKVVVLVETRDVWTIEGGIGFGRAGGKNSTRFGLSDSNFLGSGTELTFKRAADVDRTTSLFRYRNRNIRGSRAALEVAYSNNSDGELARLVAGRPFYSLDSRWAAEGEAVQDDRFDALYLAGEITDRFRHRVGSYTISGGISRGLVDGVARRLRFGLTYERDRFEAIPGEPAPAPLPLDRELAYPWIGFQQIRDGYVRMHDLDKLHRTEDLNLGHDLRLRVGASLKALGSDRDAAIVDLVFETGHSLGQRQLLLATIHGEGRFGSGGGENAIVGVSFRYFARDWREHLLFVGLRGDFAQALDGERQLLLGGDNGLRGYPLRYQAGDRRALLTIEQRFYTDWHLLKLVRVGAAVFFDAGRAWFEDPPAPDAPELGIVRDVGFGLRLGSSRSARASLVHVDLAFPLDGPRTIDRLQIVVESRETF